MFASGVPTAEKPQAKKFYLMSHGPEAREEHASAWRQYKAYLNDTSILVPLPPAIYRHIPTFLKETLLLDFPMYRFDEVNDGPTAIKQVRGTPGVS